VGPVGTICEGWIIGVQTHKGWIIHV